MTAAIVTLAVTTALKLRNLEIIQQLKMSAPPECNSMVSRCLSQMALLPSSLHPFHRLPVNLKKLGHFKISRVMFSAKEAATKVTHEELAFPLLSQECTNHYVR